MQALRQHPHRLCPVGCSGFSPIESLYTNSCSPRTRAPLQHSIKNIVCKFPKASKRTCPAKGTVVSCPAWSRHMHLHAVVKRRLNAATHAATGFDRDFISQLKYQSKPALPMVCPVAQRSKHRGIDVIELSLSMSDRDSWAGGLRFYCQPW